MVELSRIRLGSCYLFEGDRVRRPLGMSGDRVWWEERGRKIKSAASWTKGDAGGALLLDFAAEAISEVGCPY